MTPEHYKFTAVDYFAIWAGRLICLGLFAALVYVALITPDLIARQVESLTLTTEAAAFISGLCLPALAVVLVWFGCLVRELFSVIPQPDTKEDDCPF